MADDRIRFPPFYLFAIILTCAGTITALAAVVVRHSGPTLKGVLFLGCSMVSFGCGEIINHRKEIVRSETFTKEKQYSFRRRSSTSLGNLLDIVGLLLFFIALSSLIFAH